MLPCFKEDSYSKIAYMHLYILTDPKHTLVFIQGMYIDEHV